MTNNNDHKNSKSSWFKEELKREIDMIKGWFTKGQDKEVSSVSRTSDRMRHESDINHKNTETSNKGKRKHGKKSRKSLIYKIILGVVALLLISTFIYVASIFSSLQYDEHIEPNASSEIQDYEQSELDDDSELIDAYEEINISEFSEVNADTSTLDTDNLHYILLIGLDARSETNWDNASTDVMKVVVIDEDNNTIKILSLMRDILVPIEGHLEEDGTQKYGKLNSVYFFNGPESLCKTIQNYFSIPVEEYIIINWQGTAKFIDSIGGVEIDVAYNEITEINKKIKNQNKYSSMTYTTELYKQGEQILDGSQALAYMRIRNVGHGDYERVERQVIVLESIFDSLQSATLGEILSLTTILQDVVKTNIKAGKMIEYATTGYGMLDADISSITIPYGDEKVTHYAGRYNGRFVLILDFEANIKIIHDFIFDN